MPDETATAIDRWVARWAELTAGIRAGQTPDELRAALETTRELELELRTNPALRLVLLIDPSVLRRIDAAAQRLEVLIELGEPVRV
jgi:hypothetical protein